MALTGCAADAAAAVVVAVVGSECAEWQWQWQVAGF